jgi:hypothetical protein
MIQTMINIENLFSGLQSVAILIAVQIKPSVTLNGNADIWGLSPYKG